MITPRIHSQAGGRPRGRRGRARLTYANVTSTLALVIALGGASAYAASYVITSVNQIQPSVLTQFRSPVLHAFNGATSPVLDNGKLLTHLALPAGSAALLHATVSLSIHGKRGTDAYASCTLYSAGFKGAGPAGHDAGWWAGRDRHDGAIGAVVSSHPALRPGEGVLHARHGLGVRRHDHCVQRPGGRGAAAVGS